MKRIRCAIYDRVSTDIQAVSGLSLDTQKELLTEYATSHGYEIVDYYADEGLTARKKLQNRKDFQRLLHDIQCNKIDLVLVTKLDRWFRNVRDYHNTQAILEEHNCNWKTILEDYDTSTADGQLKINIMLAVAQNESDRTSERIKVVFAHKKRNGEHLTGAAPYGYITVNKKLQKDPETQHIVEELFRHYFLTFSKRQSIYHVMELYGDKAPSIYQAKRILKNETYAGRYQGNAEFCQPYITPKQFETIRNVSSAKTYTAQTHRSYIFSQLILCPVCHNRLSGFTKKQKLRDGSYNYYKRYRCGSKDTAQSHKKGGVCISESVVEQYMLEHVYPELLHRIYEIKNTGKQDAGKDKSKSIQAEMGRLTLLFQKGRVSEEYYDTQYSELEYSLNLEREKHKIVSVEDYARIQKIYSGNWKAVYDKLDDKHKNAFWKRSIKEIHIDPDTHRLYGFEFLI